MTLSESDGRLPGSDVVDFQRLIDYSTRLVDALDGFEFHSFFSLVPLLTQFLGLENPLFGSGESPYSLISILPRLRDRSLLEPPLRLSIADRRTLIDECYDMTGPILLHEEEAYIELVMDMHRGEFDRRPHSGVAFQQALGTKLAALAPLVERLRTSGRGTFAHLAHYGYTSDLQREHRFLKGLAPERFAQWCARSFPTVFELNFRGIPGAPPSVRGWIIVATNSTEQLLYSHRLRKAKVLQAAALAKALGAEVVGMAGLVAFFGRGGYLVSEQFPELGLTTGHAYTIANIMDVAAAAAARIGLALPEATVAIVGAAGSIGSGCAKLMAGLGIERLILIDIVGRDGLAPLETELRAVNGRMMTTLSNALDDMRAADLTIVATNSPRTIITPQHVKPGGIVVDDSFPKNVPETIVDERNDIVALDGSLIRLPPSVELDRARNVPNVMDVPLTRMISCREIYGCFAEMLALAAGGWRGNYGLGPADPALALDIKARAEAHGFSSAPLQFFGQVVQNDRFQRAVRARASAAQTALS
jgi:fatty aldehyde-generating acyl-ACP reductase